MRTKLVVASMVLALSSATYAGKDERVKITVAAPAESHPIQYQRGSGLIGVIRGSKTETVVFAVDVIIRGQHVRLMCDENHKGCTDFGVGDYDGELKGNNVWITIVEPLTNKVRREHWKISGSW